MIEVHPDARNSFNRRAAALVEGLSPVDLPKFESRIDWAEPYIEATLSDENVVKGPIIQWHKNVNGEEDAVWVTVGHTSYLIHGSRFEELEKLADQMQRTGGLKNVVGYRRVLELLVEWIAEHAQRGSGVPATDFVIQRISAALDRYTIVFPIYELFIEKSFEIGDVRIRAISGPEIEMWYSQWIEKSPERTTSLKNEIHNWQKRIQGRAVAECDVTAEREYAVQVALGRVEAALAMLRIFSKGAIFPTARSYCTVLGHENVESINCFIFRNGEFNGNTSQLRAPEGTFWLLDGRWIDEIMRSGLADMSALLKSNRRTEFQDRAVDALLLYSRCATERTIEGKLIYLFAGLESVFLRNQQEPIQDNVSHRLAYVIGHNIEDRRRVIEVVKDAYKLRSKFFHHGASIEEYEQVRDFMRAAWVFFTGLGGLAFRFESKEQFLEYIEDRRLAG